MSPWVLDLVQEALGLAVLIALPFVAAALAGAVVAGLLQWLTGMQDASTSMIARAVAVVVALVLLGGTMASRLSLYVREAWAELPRLGHRADGP